MSTKQPPAERANELLDAVPTSNIVTKTGAVVLGTGLAATAISQELYVVNEETVVLAGFLILATFIARASAFLPSGIHYSANFFAFQSIHQPYSEWANGQIEVCLVISTRPQMLKLVFRKLGAFSINPERNILKPSRIVFHPLSR